ncbi:hypothetical protein AAC387_Pa04g1591 [Persea americana]
MVFPMNVIERQTVQFIIDAAVPLPKPVIGAPFIVVADRDVVPTNLDVLSGVRRKRSAVASDYSSDNLSLHFNFFAGHIAHSKVVWAVGDEEGIENEALEKNHDRLCGVRTKRIDVASDYSSNNLSPLQLLRRPYSPFESHLGRWGCGRDRE